MLRVSQYQFHEGFNFIPHILKNCKPSITKKKILTIPTNLFFSIWPTSDDLSKLEREVYQKPFLWSTIFTTSFVIIIIDELIAGAWYLTVTLSFFMWC